MQSNIIVSNSNTRKQPKHGQQTSLTTLSIQKTQIVDELSASRSSASARKLQKPKKKENEKHRWFPLLTKTSEYALTVLSPPYSFLLSHIYDPPKKQGEKLSTDIENSLSQSTPSHKERALSSIQLFGNYLSKYGLFQAISSLLGYAFHGGL